jgi:hypothetical protein
MKISYYRSHKVQPEPYESHDFGARVEIDTETDKDFDGLSETEIGEELDKVLDGLLETAVQRAVALGGSVDSSHIIDYYEI